MTPPLRGNRHVPDSIRTLRREVAAALIAILERCPCCGRSSNNSQHSEPNAFEIDSDLPFVR
jgi:hypothetical protein